MEQFTKKKSGSKVITVRRPSPTNLPQSEVSGAKQENRGRSETRARGSNNDRRQRRSNDGNQKRKKQKKKSKQAKKPNLSSSQLSGMTPQVRQNDFLPNIRVGGRRNSAPGEVEHLQGGAAPRRPMEEPFPLQNPPLAPPPPPLQIDSLGPEPDDVWQEDPPAEEPWSRERTGFIYHTRVNWMFLDWRVERTGWMFSCLVPLLTPLTSRVGAVQLISYTETVNALPLVRKIADTLLIENYDLYEEFLLQLENFFYHSELKKATNYRNLAMGNSTAAQKRRDAAQRLNTWTFLSGTMWWHYAWTTTKVVATIILARSVYVGSVRFYQKFFSDLPYVPTPFVYPWIPYHQMIPGAPVLSVYVEETIKCIPWVGWRAVASVERLLNGNWKTWKWHRNSVTWGWRERIRRHLKLNETIRLGRKKSSQLREAYALYVLTGQWQSQGDVIEELEDPIFPKKMLPTLPSGTVAPYATTAGGIPLPCKEPLGIHLLFGAVTRMVAFAFTYENACAAIQMRVTSHLNSVVYDEPLYHATLQMAGQLVLDHVSDPEWESRLLPRQKQNLLQARKARLNGVRVVKNKAMLKLDETLCKGYPRFLVDLSGEFFLQQGQRTSEISAALSVRWSHEGNHPIVHTAGAEQPMAYRVYFTCGASSSSINEFVNSSFDFRGVSLMVMGDDTWMCDNGIIYENDFSRYDRTQSIDLREIYHTVLLVSGEKELLQSVLELYATRLVVAAPPDCHKRMPPLLDPSGEKADMRLTGEAATCLANSIINALCTISVHATWREIGGDPVRVMQHLYGRLGLVAKLKTVPISQSTFLKGAFLLDEEERYCWIRLPSFVAKFGKILSDPHLAIKGQIPLLRKQQMLLLGQWLGYGDMGTNWFYRHFGRVIDSLAGPVTPHHSPLREWQVLQSPCRISDWHFDEFMRSRYGISREALEEFCQFLDDASHMSIPLAYSHTVVDKLVMVDYM